jgi:NADH:ubiquinone oxidoreductase subunit 4 (subunit M)
MNFIDTHPLSLILFLPSIAALFLLFLPKGEDKLTRWFAFGVSLIPFLLSLMVWFRFQPAWLPIRRVLCLVRSNRLLPASWCGWPLAHDGLADHPSHAAFHSRII